MVAACGTDAETAPAADTGVAQAAAQPASLPPEGPSANPRKGDPAKAQTAKGQPVKGKPVKGNPVKRGEYLVTVAVCNDCHTPLVMGPNGPEPDMSRMLSGHPQDLAIGAPPVVPSEASLWLWAPHNTVFVSQLGTAYATNLTPDANTGIGAWTEEIFVNTLRSGRHWGVARPILPPMPWSYYSKMSDNDLKAIWAYLRTIPQVSNRIPEAVIAPPPPVAGAG
jgi:hypothetical protein